MVTYGSPASIAPPPGLGNLRCVPRRVTEQQRTNLEKLLVNTESWVLRFAWEGFLRDGNLKRLTPIRDLTRDQRAAGVAWMTQQQHALHFALTGERVAPAGWIEAQPLMQALREA